MSKRTAEEAMKAGEAFMKEFKDLAAKYDVNAFAFISLDCQGEKPNHDVLLNGILAGKPGKALYTIQQMGPHVMSALSREILTQCTPEQIQVLMAVKQQYQSTDTQVH